VNFLKKNHLKLITSVILLIGVILFAALLTQHKASYHNELSHALLPEAVTDSSNATSYLFNHIAGLVFFLTALTFVIISMFEQTKKYGKFVLCGAGALGIILMSVSIIGAINSQSSSLARDIMGGRHDAAITAAVEANARPQVTAAVEANRALISAGVEAAAGNTIRAGVRATMIAEGAPEALPSENWSEPFLTMFNTAVEEQLTATVNGEIASTVQALLAAAVAENAPGQISNAQDEAGYQFLSRIVTLVTQLILFGLLPLILALKKILKKDDSKAWQSTCKK